MAKGDLTVKMDNYCLRRSEGLTQRQAYRASYNAENMNDNTVDRKAFELERQDKVSARIEKYRQSVRDASIATVTERKQGLTEIFRHKPMMKFKKDGEKEIEIPPTHAERIKACSELNRMEKVYEPDDKKGNTYNINIINTDKETGELLINSIKRISGN